MDKPSRCLENVDLLPVLLCLCLYLSCFYFHGCFREGPEDLFFRLGNKMEVNVFLEAF